MKQLNSKVQEIDQSLALRYWNPNPNDTKEQSTRNYFDKYAKTNHQNIQNMNTFQSMQETQEQPIHYNTEESQVKGVEVVFKQLKNDQIFKLNELKNQYEHLKHIKVQSKDIKKSPSSSLQQSENSEILSPQKKLNHIKSSGREVQILELEKKQLESMVERSMKKVEQLLHNEMQYKKSIHELKLQVDGKGSNNNQNQHIVKLLKKKERDLQENIRILESERQSFLATINSLNEKLKYVESTTSSYESEVKRLLNENKSFEDLVRNEKDKFLTLQIEFRKVKKQYEIMERDKNLQMRSIMKSQASKESFSERETQHFIANLQDDLKVREKRFNLLLEQFNSTKQQNVKLQEEKIEQEKRFLQKLQQDKIQLEKQYQETLSQEIFNLQKKHFQQISEEKLNLQKITQEKIHIVVSEKLKIQNQLNSQRILRQKIRLEKQNQERQRERNLINDFLKKNDQDPQNHEMHEILNNILQRIGNLETKPESLVQNQLQEDFNHYQQTIAELEKKIFLDSKEKEFSQEKLILLEKQLTKVTEENTELKKKNRELTGIEGQLSYENSKLKKLIDELKQKQRVLRSGSKVSFERQQQSRYSEVSEPIFESKQEFKLNEKGQQVDKSNEENKIQQIESRLEKNLIKEVIEHEERKQIKYEPFQLKQIKYEPFQFKKHQESWKYEAPFWQRQFPKYEPIKQWQRHEAQSNQLQKVETPINIESIALNQKIKELEFRINTLLEEKNLLQKDIENYDNQNRNLKRKVHQLEFQVSKSHQEIGIKVNLEQKFHGVQIGNLIKDVQRFKRIIAEGNQEFKECKITWESTLEQKQNQIKQLKSQIEVVNRQTIEHVSNSKLYYENQLKKVHEGRVTELDGLTQKLKILTETNESLTKDRIREKILLAENEELRILLRKHRNLENGVDHLWQVKQSEYQNVNKILRQVSYSAQ